MIELPDDLLATPLPLDRFSPRSQKILQSLGISTIGDFLSTDWATVDCWQLGQKSRGELTAHRALMHQSSEDLRSWLDLPGDAFGTGDQQLQQSIAVPPQWDDIPLYLEGLGSRARGVLQREGLLTVQSLLATNIDTLQTRQLGNQARAQIKAMQSELREQLQRACSSPHPFGSLEKLRLMWLQPGAVSEATIPATQDIPYSSQAIPDLPSIWPDVMRSLVGRNNERAYEVLTRRFQLDGRAGYTLDQLGLALGVSRERVRQIEGMHSRNCTPFWKLANFTAWLNASIRPCNTRLPRSFIYYKKLVFPSLIQNFGNYWHKGTVPP